MVRPPPVEMGRAFNSAEISTFGEGIMDMYKAMSYHRQIHDLIVSIKLEADKTPSRGLSLCITKLEEANMWLNK